MRCTQYWYEVLNSKVYEGRLLQRITRQVVQFGSGSWLRSILAGVLGNSDAKT